jgi:hypothetical protein
VTMSKAAPREANKTAADALQAYLTSLLYLREEARREGLDVVAGIMWDALAAIEAWLDSGNAPAHHPDVLNSSLCHSLNFLIKWLALPPASKRKVAQEITRYEDHIGAGQAVTRPRPRASRKLAN